jgi:hypothetical protein
MQTINVRAAMFSGASVARAAGSSVANRSAAAGQGAAWKVLVQKFIAALLSALAAPAI